MLFWKHIYELVKVLSRNQQWRPCGINHSETRWSDYDQSAGILFRLRYWNIVFFPWFYKILFVLMINKSSELQTCQKCRHSTCLSISFTHPLDGRQDLIVFIGDWVGYGKGWHFWSIVYDVNSTDISFSFESKKNLDNISINESEVQPSNGCLFSGAACRILSSDRFEFRNTKLFQYLTKKVKDIIGN